MPASFPMNEAYLIGGWCSAVIWGIYTLCVGVTLYLVCSKYIKDGHVPHKITTCLVVLMWILATTYLGLGLHRLIEAFILIPPDYPHGSLGYLANITAYTNRAKDLIYITILVCGDSIIVWRCWVVWGKSWTVAALPIAMVFGTGIAGYGAIAQYWVKHPSIAVSATWGTAMFAVSLATNSFVTLLTASRIWFMTRNIKEHLGSAASRTQSAMLLLIESGAFLFAAKLVEFVLFQLTPHNGLSGFNALYIVFEMIPQIVGLMPTLIVLTVNARISIGDQITTQRSRVTGGPLVFAASDGTTTFAHGGSATVLHPSTGIVKQSRSWERRNDIELGPTPKMEA